MLRKLAARGEVGRAQVIPEGLPPGSDVGNMSILGYDPARHHTGRAPIEAAALGLTIPPDKVAFRCNLVTVDDDVMVDFAGGHPDSVTAAAAIAELDVALGSGSPGSVVEFHPGVQYRHVMVGPEDWADANCVPPHDIIGQSATAPSGPGGPELTELMRASREVLGGRSLAANQVWLWGQGRMPQLPSFGSLHGVEAGLVTAVDLVRGLGVLAGVEVIEVPGATGWYDTDYEGKRDAAIAGLVERSGSVPHPCRGERRSRSCRRCRAEDRCARELGSAHPHRARGGARRDWAPGDCCCCPTTPPRWRCGPTLPTPFRTSSSIR